ncbi:ABC transporter permease subunit [Pseudoflavitalea sp. G-6-1-2]|uniref:Gldg family protein n=1 Tax=Pseudoflavitalea sp. G-6-1-2 TaxID=2728841 RepID=UPI00146B9509|nr:Gldg family protein [Pseudoflavitalea sp. G-6-1-2]NML22566.1 ABC transporter permease subunit [Pseudoflavitalea sp. G-6-1-2]
MKTIFRVAGAELRTLFYSPIAWFLMIVFLIQCGIVYLSSMEDLAMQQEIGGRALDYMANLTDRIFLGSGGLFNNVMQNLYLYIPLLTMSLISRETSSGTIKLLYSSPIKVRHIILGKYLSMVLYSLLMVGIVFIFLLSGMFQIQSPETGMLMTAMLGFFLLLCAYSAIGLFMSCLTTYQIVAAICTFVMIGILSYIGTLWQKIEFVRNITYFLSMSGRTSKMLAGLITTKDVIYFLLIIAMFVGFSILKLKGGMESKPLSVRILRYVSIVASVLFIGYLSTIPGFIGYYDATSTQKRTLSPNVQKIIAEMKGEPLEITAYNNLLGNHWYLGAPESYNQVLQNWEPYMRFKSDIHLKTIPYYDSAYDNPWLLKGYPGKSLKEIAEQYAKTNGVELSEIKSPGEIRKEIDLKPEMNRYVMQLKWKNKTTWLRVFDDSRVWPSETEVAAAFKRLLDTKFPKVAFATGHLERSIGKMGDRQYRTLTNLKTFRYSLINQGFDADTISLSTRDIPNDISALVIADPKLPLSDAALSRIQQYIARGGNLLIAGEPGRQSILNPLLQPLGVQMLEGQIVQQSKDFSPDLITTAPTPFANTFTKQLALKAADSLPITMPGVAALTYTEVPGWTTKPLLFSDSLQSWNRKQKLDLEIVESAEPTADGPGAVAMAIPAMAAGGGPDGENASKKTTVSYSPADGDTRGALPTALSLSRKLNGLEQHIIITGDADFMSNAELSRYNIRTANFAFNTALFSWLSNGEFPIDASRPEGKDKRINLTLKQVALCRILYIWVLPALLLIGGSVFLIRRKRK